jgi:Protein of unknown function (DUF1579)
MAVPEALTPCAGRWAGTNRLQDPHANIAGDSPATAVLTPVLGGRFLRLDYTWAYRGAPQEGSILFGGDPAGALTAHWIDTWHMGDLVMACRGAVEAGGVVSVRGSYAAPPGPDWGWRIDLYPGADKLRVVMFNIWPDGREELAVEATYTRA